MKNSNSLYVAVCGAVALTLIASSCRTGPQPPQPGSPAFYWAAAKEAYRAGDYMKANQNLALVNRTSNEFTARARAWELITSAGIAEAYGELADNFEKGARQNRANPTPFRKQVTVYRASASTAAIHLAEAMHLLLGSPKEQNLPLAFDLPETSADSPPELKKVAAGILLPPAELERVERTMLRRGVLLSAASCTGTGENAAKTAEVFKQGQTARDAFLLGMAKAMFELSDLFSSRKLDQPNRLKLLCDEAQQTLDGIPATKESKELAGKIRNSQKKKKTK